MTEITPQEVLHYGEKWAADLINGLRRDVHAYADKVEQLEAEIERLRKEMAERNAALRAEIERMRVQQKNLMREIDRLTT